MPSARTRPSAGDTPLVPDLRSAPARPFRRPEAGPQGGGQGRRRRREAADDPLAGDEIADLVDRLVARLGARRVLRLAPGDSHDPLREARATPATGGLPATVATSRKGSAVPAAGRSWSLDALGDPPLRPLRLLDPPQSIETLAEIPDGAPASFRWRRVTHEIASAEGPERIAPEWWREPDGRTRDYYRVEDLQGRRFWVFRQGLYGEPGAEPRWFVHGLFA